MSTLPPGEARVKPEFLLPIANASSNSVPDDDAAESSARPTRDARNSNSNSQHHARDGPRLSKAEKKALKKAQTGSNKGRRFAKVHEGVDLCYLVAAGRVCDFGDACRNSHDVAKYLEEKPPGMRLPVAEDVQHMALPLRASSVKETAGEGQTEMEVDVEPDYMKYTRPVPGEPAACPLWEALGECRYGLRCRYSAAHTTISATDPTAFENLKNDERIAVAASTEAEMNRVDVSVLRALKGKKYPLPVTKAYEAEVGAASSKPAPPKTAVVIAEPEQNDEDEIIAERTGTTAQQATGAAAVDAPDVPVRFAEKRRLHWEGKTYLAPLTTVGNLPFRRLCVDFGADITCGEMGLAHSFLGASKEEWSLVRRHPSERNFGVQIAGSKISTVVAAAEVLGREMAGGLDFVDLNCGCPIDLVFKTGSGSALLDNPNRLGRLVVGMNRALGEVPVTVKLRTGVKEGKNTAHKLMPKLGPEFGAAAVTLHGRTRQQRYSRLADWSYVKSCVTAVREYETDHSLPRVPIFGGGDCFSSQAYWECVDQSGVDGVMIARGALIKPWIFTEIKERREWDISARERLEGIRKFAEYGLTHFGTDTAGVNSARRYLCEALSFQYRYVPLGILEVLPPRINDRAPAFRGRDELETLLASADSRDWVRISEMFLGPAPETWVFTPKHKSNAYDSQG
ncbi:unnamed protein product [Mycena citricolor]|uniref:tRNA-dihydrouridine(47) synthase [NAD(P)(+)] n=1 Tax=Mycena citricolor TaxID=2018698 RepID=A0AAD2K8D7_9AGAR|nr:unnamed protein product [Mycena citricolor]